MATAHDLLKNQGKSSSFSIAPDATALDAMKLMAEQNVGALIIKRADGELEGILY